MLKCIQWLNYHRVKINKENDDIGHIKSKWITIQYNYKPKYYKECCLKGHDEAICWNIHPELMERKKEESKERETMYNEEKENKQTDVEAHYHKRRRHFKQQWLTRRNKYKKDKFGHIIGEAEKEKQGELPEITVTNSFELLTQGEQVENVSNKDKVNEEKQIEQSTKDWVLNSFENKSKNKQKDAQAEGKVE